MNKKTNIKNNIITRDGELECYIYENKKTKEVNFFLKSGNEFKFKKVKKNTGSDSVLNYALNISQYVLKMILYTNLIIDKKKEKEIKEDVFIEYKKKFPVEFINYIKDHNIKKSAPKLTEIEIDVFEKENNYFISTVVKSNEKKKSFLRIKSSLENIEGEVFNYLKDMIKIFGKEGVPIHFITGIKGVKEYFDTKLKNNNKVKKRINEMIYRDFDEFDFIDKNNKKIDDLLISHNYDLKIKEEVSVDYSLPPNKNKILIYTDASTYRNRFKGINKSGYGAIIKQDGSEEVMFELTRKLEKSEMLFISDISEGQAIYESLKFLSEQNIIDKNTIIEIRSDSLSNIRKLNSKEDFKHIFSEKTLDLSENIESSGIIYRWVKGHSRNKYNVLVDKMAEESLKNLTTDLIIKRNEKALLNFVIRKDGLKNNKKGPVVDPF